MSIKVKHGLMVMVILAAMVYNAVIRTPVTWWIVECLLLTILLDYVELRQK